MSTSHADRNRETRYQWDSFRPHRARLTRLIVDACMPTGDLCVLGAGNCNDLDLQQLSRRFHRIVLIDIDQDAMQWGIESQHAENVEAVARDLLADEIPNDTFDVVVSSCLLTQLYLDIDSSLKADASAYADLRQRHFESMIRLMKAGATGIFVTDVVSSDTCSDLPGLTVEQLKDRLPRLIEQHNFFTGTNPAVVHHLLTADPDLAELISDVRPIDPWLWNPGPRTYACYGMRFSRSD